MNGVKYFELQSAGLEDDSMMLTDTKGREVSALHRAAAVQLYNAEIQNRVQLGVCHQIGGFLHEKLCKGKRAHITVKKDGKSRLLIATEDYKASYFQAFGPRSLKVRCVKVFEICTVQ